MNKPRPLHLRVFMVCEDCKDFDEIVCPTKDVEYESYCPFCEQPSEQMTYFELPDWAKKQISSNGELI